MFRLTFSLACLCFNPRSHKGNDEELSSSFLRRSSFQSTFPQGERQTKLMSGLSENDVSIHVPTRGTTIQETGDPDGLQVSIHVPTRGTTIPCAFFFVLGITFQSTFPQGERQQSSINFLYISCYYLCNYTNIIPVMQAQLTILISFYLNITVRISQTLYARFCFAPIRYCIAALSNITKATIIPCS